MSVSTCVRTGGFGFELARDVGHRRPEAAGGIQADGFSLSGHWRNQKS